MNSVEIEFKEIGYKDAIEFLLPRHYSGRKPPITVAYGAMREDVLLAVCTFGKPASPSLCKGVCGEEYSNKVYELNRLCKEESYDRPISEFVSWCLRQLKSRNWIAVSYSDTAMNHNGYIYQACNFIYTGATASRTDKYTEGNKHSRHYKNDENQQKYRKVRSSKHRYIYFCCKSKSTRRHYKRCLKYKVQIYPKGKNKRYMLGTFLKQEIIKEKTK